MIKFETKLEPRTKDGGFGPSDCAKCGAKTTVYLKVHIYTTYVLLCMGCLQEGINLIRKSLLESFERR